MASDIKKWGIIGTGEIASRLALAIQQVERAEVYGVGSRDISKSLEFKEKYGTSLAFGSYEDLCECPEIDIIYVATPHSFHNKHTKLALNNGKHVLCEKPFALNLEDTEEMIGLAREKNLFLMEAMWTCLLPGMQKLKSLIQEGAIGKVQYIEADFGFQAPYDPNARLFNKDLGGGALLDVGIYPLSLAAYIFGQPIDFNACARLGVTGVDEVSTYNLKFANGVIANLSSSITVNTSHAATFYGTEGKIHIPADWWKMEKIILTNGINKTIDTSYDGSEYVFEVQEVIDCLDKNLIESPKLNHDWTKNIMSLIDQIKEQIGVEYTKEIRSNT